MKIKRNITIAMTIALSLYLGALANAQDDSVFTDPSLLQPFDKGTFDLKYRHPDIASTGQRYDSIMLD